MRARSLLTLLSLLAIVATSIGCARAPGACATGPACDLPDAAIPSSDAAPSIDAAAEDASATDAATGDGGAGLTPGCSVATPRGCDYLPEDPRAERPVTIESISYTDVSGAPRTFEIAIHRPEGAPSASPVIVWSHGGADGIAHADHVGEEWARIFTAAGYVVVAIAHVGRDEPSRSALCTSLGFDEAGCMLFKYLNWDRPHDVRRVIDWIEEESATGALSGVVDPSRLAYAGHSAGGGAVMMVAGASRDYAGVLRTLDDPRPIAFLACSPQGPGEDGFVDASFDAIARPLMTLSGAGDDTSSSVAEDRRLPFERMMPGEKYLGWIASESARHETFDQNVDACLRYVTAKGGDITECDAFRPWLASAALAFFDAQLRESADARAYLASDDLAVLSSGVMELSRR